MCERCDELEAAVAVLTERLEKFGRILDDGVTCAMCHDSSCARAIVSTCIGWLARHTLSTLPTAVQASMAQRRKEREALRWIG